MSDSDFEEEFVVEADTIHDRILAILDDYEENPYNYKLKKPYTDFAIDYPGTAPLCDFYMEALARPYTAVDRRAMQMWSLHTDTLIRGIAETSVEETSVDFQNPVHRDIVGINLCMLTGAGARYLRDKKSEIFGFLYSENFDNISDRIPHLKPKHRNKTLCNIMRNGHEFVPYKPWAEREDEVKNYVLTIINEQKSKAEQRLDMLRQKAIQKDAAQSAAVNDVALKHALRQDVAEHIKRYANIETRQRKRKKPVTMDEAEMWINKYSKEGPKVHSYSDTSKQRLRGVMQFLNDFFVETLRECAVPVPPEGVKVVRLTNPDNPPKCGLRACSVAGPGVSSQMPHWNGSTSTLMLEGGTLVVPAMILYSDVPSMRELEMLIVDGHYKKEMPMHVVRAGSEHAGEPLRLRL